MCNIMFKRRDIPPFLLLSLLILLIILTLSQILVVHTGHLGSNRHNMRKLQVELRELDINLHSVMMHRVPSIELNKRLLQNQINSNKFLEILNEASKRSASEIKTSSFRDDTDDDDLPYKDSFQSNISLQWDSFTDKNNTVNNNNSKYDISKVQDWSLSSNITSHHHKQLKYSQIKNLLLPTAQRNTSPKVQYKSVKDGVNNEGRVKYNNPDDKQESGLSNHTVINSHGSHSNYKVTTHYCDSVPPNLRGSLLVDTDKALHITYEKILNTYRDIEPGGIWRPTTCTARHKVAIVIPYRDRRQHLMGLLYYLHPLLQAQQLDYRIFVVEQQGNDTFNKARLMNVAFVEALKLYPFQCVVFHDVDLIPEDDRNMYSCPVQPRHTSVAIDEMNYKLAYPELVGGVLNMRREHFQMVNGYSNLYWGWGAEDDDMAYRIMQVGLKITRPPESIARYKTIKHTKRKPSDWRKRAKLLVTGPRRYQFDGLNSLTYKLTHIKDMSIYTHLLIDLGKPPKSFT